VLSLKKLQIMFTRILTKMGFFFFLVNLSVQVQEDKKENSF